MRLTFDIFCKVIDNYGDIGVCWRLARQLANRSDCGAIRLWVDDLKTFQRIASSIRVDLPIQTVAGVIIIHDASPSVFSSNELMPADVVIEAFACSPPREFIERMSAQQLWINLEYLSAEAWIDGCHGLPSIQGNGLRKFFFFPGFTDKSGGLLREPGLIDRRRAWESDPNRRTVLLEKLGVEKQWLQRLKEETAALVYVYCYPHAPLPALLNGLAHGKRDTLVLIPEGIWQGSLPSTAIHGHRQLEVKTVPFVDQDDFDHLLWSSDLNVVRGEDSMVRAIWAARPFLWQPYLQQEGAHLEKLQAWLGRTPYPSKVQDLILAWNQADTETSSRLLAELVLEPSLQEWLTSARQWCVALAEMPHLTQRLVEFCANHWETR